MKRICELINTNTCCCNCCQNDNGYLFFSNLKKTSVCVPPNFFLHNQYLSPYLISNLGPYYKIAAVSEYDKSRYTRLGYTEEQVEVLDPGYFNDLRKKLKPFKTIKTVTNTHVLILPPWLDVLDTYRHLISAHDLIYYFSDILDTLDILRISLNSSKVKLFNLYLIHLDLIVGNNKFK